LLLLLMLLMGVLVTTQALVHPCLVCMVILTARCSLKLNAAAAQLVLLLLLVLPLHLLLVCMRGRIKRDRDPGAQAGSPKCSAIIAFGGGMESLPCRPSRLRRSLQFDR
jgi:hypothetical protein